MRTDPLLRAWGWLLILSAVSTVLAGAVTRGLLPPAGMTAAGAAILFLAWAKAGTIISRYLGLADAPFWHRGFRIVMAAYALLLLALYAMA